MVEMREHEFSVDCWCAPSVTMNEVGPPEFPGPVRYTTHHGAGGEEIFFTLDDDAVPICVDCGEVIPDFLPEPPWIWRGRIFSTLMRNAHKSYGLSMEEDCEGDHHVSVGFGKVSLNISIGGERRQKSVGEVVEESAPSMIADLEAHLRSHE